MNGEMEELEKTIAAKGTARNQERMEKTSGDDG